MGGEIVVNLDADGNLLSASGEALPPSQIETAPKVSASEARVAARSASARSYSTSPGDLEASEPELWIYDSRILGGPGLDVPTLVWRTEVTSLGSHPIDELVLVDARLGFVVLRFSQIEEVLDRVICDAANTNTKVPCVAPYARVEGGPPSAVTDVNDAYDFSGDTYDLFSLLGRDSLDDAA